MHGVSEWMSEGKEKIEAQERAETCSGLNETPSDSYVGSRSPALQADTLLSELPGKP